MPIFVELKTETGRLSGSQKVWAARLRELHQRVRTVYGLSGLEELFRELGMPDSAARVRQKREMLERRKNNANKRQDSMDV